MAERIFVAVAWPYTNGPRHLGHVAGFGVPSDVFARYPVALLVPTARLAVPAPVLP